MTKEEGILAIRDRRPEDNIVSLLKEAGLPRRWTTPITIGGRTYTPERETIYEGACPERGLAHKFRAEYPKWVSREREYALDSQGRRKKDAHGEYILKRERVTQEAWMGRIRCESCGKMLNVEPDLIRAFADDLAAHDAKYYSNHALLYSGPTQHWGEHNIRQDEAEERARKLAENPPPKRRMCY